MPSKTMVMFTLDELQHAAQFLDEAAISIRERTRSMKEGALRKLMHTRLEKCMELKEKMEAERDIFVKQQKDMVEIKEKLQGLI